MVDMNRRTFLDVAGVSVLAGLSMPIASAAPSERVRHALIGTGNQGKRHAQLFSEFEDCDLVAICDVDPVRRNAFAEKLSHLKTLAVYDDYRRIIDDPEIDSVSIATPDHWHTPLALAALKAGKHVYVEKPCSHNIAEAQMLMNTAEASGKCVQHGTQGRAGKALQEAVAFMRDGGIGQLRMAKAINHQHRPPIGREPECDPPEGVNYDMWLGPAPKHAFTQNRWHYNWHWFWDYGSGDIGNDGIHQLDQARWGLGVTIPSAVVASGGQYYYDDDHETPDTQTVIYEYDECQLVFEMRLWTNYKLEGHDNGVVFYGDNGKVEFGREGSKATFLDGQEKVFGPYADIKDHFRNFLDCVKANDPSGLNSHIREGAISTTLCHLGNIATRVKRRLVIEPETWQCVNDPEAAALYKREYRKGYELPV
jgi:predicted dehydrogenase